MIELIYSFQITYSHECNMYRAHAKKKARVCVPVYIYIYIYIYIYHLRVTLNCAPNFVGHELLLSMDSLTENYFQRYI
jgi:hypothetical protein